MKPEARYRPLLALYPRDFRQEYGDEMLGVLMADPRPGVAQTFDVVRGALAAHLRGLETGRSRAARVVQIFGAMLLFALGVRRVAGVAIRWATGADAGFVPHLPALDWARPVVWGVVLVAGVVGWRWLGAAGAAVGLAAEIVVPFQSYVNAPATVLYAYWIIVASAVVLAATLVAEGGGPMRPRGGWLVAAAGVLLVSQDTFMPYQVWSSGSAALHFAVQLIVMVVAAPALVVAALVRQEPEVRRRLLVWVAPVLITVPLVQWGFGGLIAFNMAHTDVTHYLGPLQWAALVLVPVATFVAVSALDRRVSAGRPRARRAVAVSRRRRPDK
ncbi:hypothetical protein KOI35_00110 [Actinoplanes bogorensis]|uniref:Uncharacterized protein n=1 Tax=Paractinoplanes bogorensis TaxID=1610840 RepID=A0ABS5YES2_9ACTN|nr:hypothetical protein [Actinoplanes bogorensis]MBU2661899.1 hypothetical protein [Actinoplanes bogorensis]